MGFSFIEIEEQKSRLIFLLFLFLMLFYFIVAWLLIIPFNLVFFSRISGVFLPTLKQMLIAFILAVIAGAAHWSISVNGVVARALASIGARPVDEKDIFHVKFKNIVEEASVAAGGRRVEPWVIPVSALNAFALSDFSGRAVIGVTEGLLAKLNRSQLEAVIGHEFGHILSGDSIMTTITSSLFGIYSSLMDGIRRIFESGRHTRFSRSRGGGGVYIFLVLVYLILAVTKFMSKLLNMFISRQREYRADAIAVRLTRNPLALAEALHLISRGWRGAYLSSEHLASIFIVNPVHNNLDESESFFSDIFSTHPPIKKRIAIAVDMAHINVKNMEDELKQKSVPAERMSSTIQEVEQPEEDRWFAVDSQGQWQGPFAFGQMAAMPWITAETWVHKEFDSKVQYAWQNDDIRGLLQGNGAQHGRYSCPRCNFALKDVLYEGVPLWHCSGCAGNLVERSKIMRILTRRQQGFSAEVEQMGKVIKTTVKHSQISTKAGGSFGSAQLFNCPLCRRPMRRQFYNFDYLVEIDLCLYCDIIWFDKNELEVLQFLYEQHDELK
ncbi:MAG: M48 family metalloprotease [Candidatus Omnitrophica bacterium]|nr:M48 family metalloprotease [Candidatus Omnitrophota bacterium]MBU4479044.1 M48 family metalloprotease [Candidatus Omnitrophota bacterium]MCG2703468.1 M48 family metalloprotease [Candidatus Omnitrophota bacterium]